MNLHGRCDSTLADLRTRLDAANLHILSLEADLRMATAQLVDALKPTPQQQLTDTVLQDMVMPEPIAQAIRQVAGDNPALARHLDNYARGEIDHGRMISEIAHEILNGDDDTVSRETSPDLGFIPPTEAREALTEDDEIPLEVGR